MTLGRLYLHNGVEPNTSLGIYQDGPTEAGPCRLVGIADVEPESGITEQIKLNPRTVRKLQKITFSTPHPKTAHK